MKGPLIVLLTLATSLGPLVPARAGDYPESPRTFTGRHLSEIEYPIGGIGTGNILLGGRGQIEHIELFNRPNRKSVPTATFFALWWQEPGRDSRAMVLERQLLPPVQHAERRQLAGLPRFREVVFEGTYPFAHLSFEDERVPLEVSLEAYNPFIPLEPDESAYPAAIFNWRLKNPRPEPIEVSIAFSMQNPIRARGEDGELSFGGNLNEHVAAQGFRAVRMSSRTTPEDAYEFGDIAIATTEPDVDVQTRWYRGGWWDNAHVFWNDFRRDGRLPSVTDGLPSESGRTDVACVIARATLEPGEERVIPFYLTWYFPTRFATPNDALGQEEAVDKPFRNHYANRFTGAVDVAEQLLEKLPELEAETRLFHETLLGSTYPAYVLDAVTSQASSLKTPLIHRMEGGELHGFEGVLDDGFCCAGSCQHVWNYEQTLAYLFPSLERTMRDVSFLHDTHDNGFHVFRAVFPLGDYWFDGPPAADGQFGNIVRLYRDWKLSGDNDWLRRLWPKVKLALEYAWKGPGRVEDPKLKHQERHPTWDPDKQGIWTPPSRGK